ncbi:MAG: GAF domain-containing protein [Chlamydiales bacterium]|jgi:GAF domain-containing protein
MTDTRERILDADLVSIWKFKDDPDRIECLLALDALTNTVSDGQSLLESDFPVYFKSIVEETTVCAPVATEHPMTRELAEPYFEPNGILSLLDFIVHHDFKPAGIICCESRSKRRDWSQADRDYLLRLATIASFNTRI